MQDLLKPFQYKRLIENGKLEIDPLKKIPVVYLLAPNLEYQWLLIEMNVLTPHKALAIVDLNNNHPTLETINLDEIIEMKNNNHWIVNNTQFSPKYETRVFQFLANQYGVILASENGLEHQFKNAQLHFKND